MHNPEDKPEPPSPNRSLIDIGSSLLFLYLQLGIQSTLRKVYPKNPDVADKWLAREIERASADPGALQVFKSGAYLPRPVPITHLIKTFGKPVLVLQGVLDPLNNAADRATQLGAVAPTVEVVRLEAGHCPHDEVPGEVNSYLADFASRCVAKARGGVLSVTSS